MHHFQNKHEVTVDNGSTVWSMHVHLGVKLQGSGQHAHISGWEAPFSQQDLMQVLWMCVRLKSIHL